MELSTDEYSATVSEATLREIRQRAQIVAQVAVRQGIPFDVTLRPEPALLQGWYLRSYRVQQSTERDGLTTWALTNISVLGQDGNLYDAEREEEVETFTTWQNCRDELTASPIVSTEDVFGLERSRRDGTAVGGSTAFGESILADLQSLEATRTTYPRRAMIPAPRTPPTSTATAAPASPFRSVALILLWLLIIAVCWQSVFPPLAITVAVVGVVYLIRRSRRRPRRR